MLYDIVDILYEFKLQTFQDIYRYFFKVFFIFFGKYDFLKACPFCSKKFFFKSS